MKQNKYRRYPGMGGGKSRPDGLEQRRADAAERNAAWEALPKAKKIQALKLRPGKCARQLARLAAAP